jgi:ElaA protein
MITWQWQSFEELDNHALYQVLALRQRVFVIEQQCIYPDLDGHDQQAMHLLGWQTADGQRRLAAYCACWRRAPSMWKCRWAAC